MNKYKPGNTQSYSMTFLLLICIFWVSSSQAETIGNDIESPVQSAEREYSNAKNPGAFGTAVSNYDRGTAYYREALKTASNPVEVKFIVNSMNFMMMPKTPMVAPPLNEAL